jgi:DNA-binding NtrC family response regulator
MVEKKIVLYEQYKGVRFVLERSLSKFEDEIDIVSSYNKRKIREYLKDGIVDLLITDLDGNSQNGVGLSNFARKTAPQLDIIWITVFGCNLFRTEKRRLGNIICLEKPLDIKRFRKTVLNALNHEPH